MKPPLLLSRLFCKLILIIFLSLLVVQHTYAQSLSFRAPILESGSPLQVGAQYRFANVMNRVDALVTITNLVNGAAVINMDTHATEGYDASFQPLIYTPAGSATSYALFTISFVSQGSYTPASISEFATTVLDVDGNATLKEFSEISFAGNNPLAEYITPNSRITVATEAHGYSVRNADITERPGIDTSAANLSSLFCVKAFNVENLTVKLGAITTASAGENRVYSMYMKSFLYNNAAADYVTLPVKLVAFSAVLSSNKVDIKWTTASEINTKHFIVEKSNDGISFSNLEIISAKGTATDKSHYNVADIINNTTKIIYYRLRSVDNNGKSELSDIRIIRTDKEFEKGTTVVIYPNPVSNELRVTIPAIWQNKKVIYEIVDINGITAKRVQSNSSSQTENINVTNLASGVYILRTSTMGLVEQQRIIKR